MFVVGNGRSIPTLNTNERKSGSETRIKPSYDLKPTNNRFSHTVALYLCLKPYLVCRNYTSIFRNILLFTSPISKYVLTASPSDLTLSRHFKICLKDFLVTFILPHSNKNFAVVCFSAVCPGCDLNHATCSRPNLCR